MKARRIAVGTALSFLLAVSVSACTTAVVSGAATADGRPLLWKNRDADDRQNQVVHCADGKYSYIGLVNRGDASGIAIWAGINSQGFAIMNSASYNLEGAENSQAEGNVMKLALQSCATVADFQALLETSDAGGRDVASNFGVIDARGGAAYFETDRKSYKRFNADDPAVAPGGFIVRTNFSESGDPADGTGFTRFRRASGLIAGAVGAKRLSAQLLLKEMARDTANERIGSYPLAPHKKGAQAFAYTLDSVCRFDTASCAVFAGVKPGEDPALSTMWVIVGLPASGVAVPVWEAAGGVPKEVAASCDPSPMTAAFDAVKALLYPETKGDLQRYMDVDALANPKTGFLAPLLAVESENFTRADEALARWRRQKPSPQELSALQNEISSRTLAAVQALLNARRKDVPTAVSAPGQSARRNGVSVTAIQR
jgi:hypothetical protein